MAATEERTASGSVVVRSRKRHWLFDRPKQPHDWRWVVGGIGRTLIVIGLLMFAFVAYQLWGTGIYTAQAQNKLEDQFAEAGVAATTLPPTTAAPTTAPPTTATDGGATTAPTSAAPTTTAPAVETVPYPFAIPEDGQAVVQLQIPSIGVDYIVVEGVAVNDLKKGPGRFAESVLPGQLGNAAIAGHRTTHGAPFYKLDHLDAGDTIVITYPPIGDQPGPQFTYVVTETDIVSPKDYAAVVPTTDPTKATLVLVTCHPIRTASQRMVVHAELDPSRSSTLFGATPPKPAGDTAELPGDEPATDDTTVGTDATGQPVPTTTGAATTSTTTGAGAGTVTPSTSVAPPAASEDAFAGGWFDDSAAWPDIVLWGLLLAAICVGGYLLAKRTRRIWLGALVSFVPFVVVLYFWFENVNRLLPPGL